ncbi:Cytochrome b-c1 complex subunit 7-1 [Capsicum annuum]|nr:Cytochrome b-c1 complex subunit 7-1 [Capsicum annuum]
MVVVIVVALVVFMVAVGGVYGGLQRDSEGHPEQSQLRKSEADERYENNIEGGGQGSVDGDKENKSEKTEELESEKEDDHQHDDNGSLMGRELISTSQHDPVKTITIVGISPDVAVAGASNVLYRIYVLVTAARADPSPTGLRYDDLYDPMYDLDMKGALNRLPREIVDARNQSLLRAMDLSMKHLYLPEDLQRDYYKQSAYLKIKMLRCFYDDVIEAEAIKSTLNRRIMAAENTNFYQNLKSCSSKYMRASMNVVADGRFIDSIDCTDGCRPGKMYFLRTLIEKTLKDREDFLVEPNSVSNLVPPDENVGFIFLFIRKVLRYFRKDGHNWRRKDGKTVKEAQEKLEIGKRSSEFVMCLHVVAALNCRIRKYNEVIPHLERSIEIPDLDMGQNLSLLENSILYYTDGLEIQRKVLEEKDTRFGDTYRMMELTSENVYGTVSSAIMKLPDTNSVAAGLNRDLDSQLKTMSSSFLVVHPWIVPTKQELRITSFITLGHVDTRADPTVELIKKELDGATTIRRTVRQGQSSVKALHDQTTATDPGASSGGVASGVDVGGRHTNATPSYDVEHVDAREKINMFENTPLTGRSPYYTGPSQRYTGLSHPPSPSCSHCKCEECKDSHDKLFKKIEAIAKAVEELKSKMGVIPSKKVRKPYIPTTTVKRRKSN